MMMMMMTLMMMVWRQVGHYTSGMEPTNRGFDSFMGYYTGGLYNQENHGISIQTPLSRSDGFTYYLSLRWVTIRREWSRRIGGSTPSWGTTRGGSTRRPRRP
jgi:hypothetical protein